MAHTAYTSKRSLLRMLGCIVYMDALAVLPFCERRQQPPDQPQAEVFRTPCEALEPSGRDMPPAFLKALSRRRLYEGSTLRLVAEVVGVPKPGVKWYHNKSLLEMHERVRIEKDGDKCVLEITNVQKADGGQYLCHAVNIVGEARTMCKGSLVVVAQQGPLFSSNRFQMLKSGREM
uniref:Ig-like domain-containing protein n=1 Tax=Calidris pygmaea TaxID=425635 RepID=A0A8C3KMZ0_9CHAR